MEIVKSIYELAATVVFLGIAIAIARDSNWGDFF